MDTKLCRQACAVMDCDLVGFHHFLTNAILWAGANIADFRLQMDDFNGGVWEAVSFMTTVKATNAHDAMASLILAYAEATAGETKEPSRGN